MLTNVNALKQLLQNFSISCNFKFYSTEDFIQYVRKIIEYLPVFSLFKFYFEQNFR